MLNNGQQDNDTLLTFIFTVKGEINGESLSAAGTVRWPNAGVFNGNLTFDEKPVSYTPLASGGSILSLSCSNFAEESGGAVNLISLTGGNYEGFRSYVIQNPTKKVIGAIISTLKMRKIGDVLYKADIHMCGTYNGPTDFSFMDGYKVTMEQKSPGRIGGHYKQLLATKAENKYLINASTEYVYNNDKNLPFPSVWSVDYSNIQHFINETGNYELILNGKTEVRSL
ncbi:hypothetical protein [Bacillus cereus]|uniref:hypothetical protein n=1 Tax=Bacillus cereus TaxID=1396 RepID=UPI000BF33B95|nr:hypothetical protein [Bacillus cereus]PEU03205.1 hypothetical protein CN534_05145 [Bacillus cereus]PEZ62107.1 hypothetical protein CN370_09500 [Bacillus cereus]PFB67175.1 hypothetical protein CN292_21330 [Bacillus cereus]